MDSAFDPQMLAADLLEVRRIYADYFARLTDADWVRPAKKGPEEWNVQKTVAHLCALNGSGLDSVQARLRDEPYVFRGLENRYQFDDFNHQGIEARLHQTREALGNELLAILNQCAEIAGSLLPDQAALTAEMPIYNRPLTIVEALSIIMFHTGLNHAAQVAEPAGEAPLWLSLAPDIRHRTISRVMRALSLLYRFDLAGDLRAVIAFHVLGEGGGQWYVELSPERTASGEGPVDKPSLAIRFRDTDLLCQMFSGRINLPLALITGRMRPRGDLRLFLRFGTLFNVVARG